MYSLKGDNIKKRTLETGMDITILKKKKHHGEVKSFMVANCVVGLCCIPSYISIQGKFLTTKLLFGQSFFFWPRTVHEMPSLCEKML